MVTFRLKLAVVLVLWKNNVVDFTVDTLAENDPGNPSDCMIVDQVNDNGCEVDKPIERPRSKKETQYPLQDSYDTVVSVVALTCSDALFDAISNYIQMIEDAEFLK